MLTNKTIINADFEPLKGSDTVYGIKDRMDEQQLEVLPVVDSTTKKLIGQVSYEQLSVSDPGATIADLDLGEVVKIYQGQHIFEAARLMLQYELRQLPVVDEEWTFLGIIDKRQVLESLSRMLNLAEFGSVITIELDRVDFAISEIVNIIETEGAKILGLTVETPDREGQTFEVSFKLNIENISRVTSALRRYEYTVVAESTSEVFGSDLESRAGEMVKYMDM